MIKPEEAVHVMISSLSKGTLNQYEICYRKWWIYCERDRTSLLEFNFKQLLAFLQEQMNINLLFSTLNMYRSALSLINPISPKNENIVKRFLKGVSNI